MRGNRENQKPKRQSRTIFRMILHPQMVLLFLEVLLLVGFLVVSGVFRQLNQNALDILSQQTENRSSYLENEMVNSWSDIVPLAKEINANMEMLLASGEIDLEALDSDSTVGVPLIQSVITQMIETMYTNKVSGIYLIFSTSDPVQEMKDGVCQQKTGIHIRDLDPLAKSSTRYADLLLECAPIEVVCSMPISTDSRWNTRFCFDENAPYGDYLLMPYMAVHQGKQGMDTQDYGCWSVSMSDDSDSFPSTLTYNIPLMLRDGTVYGVLGIELLNSYLKRCMPTADFGSNSSGAYLLARVQEQENTAVVYPVAWSGTAMPTDDEGKLTIQRTSLGQYVSQGGQSRYRMAMHQLILYSSYTPFANETWALLGVMPESAAFSFSHRVAALLWIAVILVLVVGNLGSVLISRRLSRPISVLSHEVDIAQKSRERIPVLSETGIIEIDRFSSAITQLSQDVLDASTRMLQIMRMSSVNIAGYDISDRREDHVFITDNFLPMLGVKNVSVHGISQEKLMQMREELFKSTHIIERGEQSWLFEVPVKADEVRYVRVQETRMKHRIVGIGEDVTAVTLERMRIEKERDYDLLTSLYNRRAFYRIAESLFANPNELGFGAMVMMDLDNLKHVNDTYGHEWGDHYIRAAAECFAHSVPRGTLCSRISGDEFTIFFYGYDNGEQAERAVEQLIEGIRQSVFILPDGTRDRIRASGGIARYPQDACEFKALIKLADETMYIIKHSTKGAFRYRSTESAKENVDSASS